jgi:SAM-dependent methyltransferase
MLKSLFDSVMERRARGLLDHVGAWLPAEGPVLDLGSGTGHFAALLERERGLDVITADVSDMHVVGRSPILISEGALPFENDRFSAALLFFMLAYPKHPSAVLAEVARVTRGPIILVQSLHSNRFGYAWLRVREFIWTIVAFHVSKLIGYVPSSAKFSMRTQRFYRAEELRRDLAAAGLEVRSCAERVLLPGRSLVVAGWRASRRPHEDTTGSGLAIAAKCRLSFVIPARNEQALIGETVEAILASAAQFARVARRDLWLPDHSIEVIVADDGSEDGTAAIARKLADDAGVRLVQGVGGTCAAARNIGAAASRGRVLCFVDADTIVPENSVERILELHEEQGRCLVLYRLESREPGFRPWLWWTFWGLARRLPIARAKSMPAFLSCDRTHFEQYGPFNESYAIAEEWPLTIAAYRHHRGRFLYDRSLTARTSSRRMELQPFGYARTFLKWVMVVLFPWARTSLSEHRHEAGQP